MAAGEGPLPGPAPAAGALSGRPSPLLRPFTRRNLLVGWSAAWLGLTTGLPLGGLLSSAGEPRPAHWIAFGLWLVLFPVAALPVFGLLINDMADRSRRAEVDASERSTAGPEVTHPTPALEA